MSAAEEILSALARRAPVTARMVILAAHPDDEAIGLGAALGRLRDALLVHVTDGAPRDGRDMKEYGFSSLAEYAAARQRELSAALAAGGAGRLRRARLGRRDGEAWRDLADLARQIRDLLAAERPAALFTHPYEGGHPDHDAAAFAARAACRMLGDRAPALLEMTSYHAGPQGRATGTFLPGETAAAALVLNLDERRRKEAMIACFLTQRAVLAGFEVAVERYRAAPRYDFTEPPHPGRLFYEGWDWAPAGALWRERAAAALVELGMPARP